MKFWDTSALVPLFIDQPQSATARAILADDPETVLWWSTAIEFESALARSHREAVLDEEEIATARESYSLLRESAVEVHPSEELRATAIRQLAEHTLRAADALQLAAALTWTGADPAGSGFVTFDDHLRRTAASEGFSILPRGEG